MKKALLCTLVLVTVAAAVSGQSLTAGIDSALLKKSNAVIKEYHVTYDVKSPSNIEKRVKYSVVILNQGGRDEGDIQIYTDSDEKITSFSGSVRKNDGALQTKMWLDDLESRPSYPDFVFLSDSKRHFYHPVIENYPYSVEYEYVLSLSGMLEFDPWFPVSDLFVACDTSSYSLIYPADYKIFFREAGLLSQPVITKAADGRSKMIWSIDNIKALDLKYFVPPAENILPCLYVNPEKFRYDDHDGYVKGWNDYGIWMSGLLMNRDVIPPELQSKLAAMIADCPDTRSKVARIYKYLQENTRYVAIALGIGGLQPAPAAEVAKYGYGDCKGLSNFMKAMLSSAGIKSYYAEIGNGSRKIKPDYFSKTQTNHAILCVPDNKDTIWLECTSQYYNAGYLGYSNSNRKALLITENGGVLVNTPRADSSNSYSRNRFDIIVSNKGTSSYRIKAYCTGDDYEDFLYLDHVTKENSIRYLYDNLPFKNHSIVSYSVTPDSLALAGISTTIEGQFNKYATVAGKRLIIPLVPYRLFDRVPKIEPDRQADIYISKHTARTDTICISVPSGYNFNVNEELMEFSNEIGHYEQKAVRKGNEVIILRKVFISPCTCPVEMKDKVTEFYKKSHDIESRSLICEQAL